MCDIKQNSRVHRVTVHGQKFPFGIFFLKANLKNSIIVHIAPEKISLPSFYQMRKYMFLFPYFPQDSPMQQERVLCFSPVYYSGIDLRPTRKQKTENRAKTDLLPVLNGLNPACHLSQFVDIRNEAGLHLQPVCPGMLTR